MQFNILFTDLSKLLILFLVGFVRNESPFTTYQIPKSELTHRPSSLVLIETKLGTVIGYEQKALNRTINVFYGLPYAEPPVGELRFKKTKLIKKFPHDPYSALSFKPHCRVLSTPGNYHPNDSFSEDCLYLNIWTPNLVNTRNNGICKKRYPVIIYFYGKDQSIYRMSPYAKPGHPHLLYSGELFALQDTVFVNFNHRHKAWATLLHANLMLFDQNLAIRWVKSNIDAFCGDGDRITVLSSSLGSITLQHHLISSHSNGLFQNAILGSPAFFFNDLIPVSYGDMKINSFLAIDYLGCVVWSDEAIAVGSLSEAIRSKYFVDGNRLQKSRIMDELLKNWYVFRHPRLREKPKQLDETYLDSDLLKLTEFLFESLVDQECLQNLPPERIDQLHQNFTYSANRFTFCYDFDFISTETYLNYKLFNKLTLNPQLNLLIGGVLTEDCSATQLFSDKYYADQFNAPVMSKREAAEIIINYRPSPFEEKQELATKMADYYTDESKLMLADGYYTSVNNFVSDLGYAYSYHFFASYAAMTAKSVWSYQITQMPSQHWMGFYRQMGIDVYAWLGLCHGDELLFLNGEPHRSPDRFTELERRFSLQMVEMWTHFAKNSRMPRLSNGEEWPVSSKERPAPRYVELNHKFVREHKFEFEERLEKLWKPLVPFFRT